MCLSLFCFYQVTNVKVRLPLLEQQNNLAAVLGKYTPFRYGRYEVTEALESFRVFAVESMEVL